MTYVVKRIDEQMYGCEEPAPGAEVLVDVTLVATDGVKRVLPYPDAALAAADINEGDTAVLTADGLLKKVYYHAVQKRDHLAVPLFL